MNCSLCGRDNPEGAKFCRGCGAALDNERTCPNCGARNLSDSSFCSECGSRLTPSPLAGEGWGEGARVSPLPVGAAGQDAAGDAGRVRAAPQQGTPPIPTSFVRDRYAVQRFLGEGGKKRVYLAHDAQLDRDVAFALLKSDGLDVEGLVRIRREAQAMGRLGDHPHIVTVFDIGDENGQPYIVSQYMAGGSLQSLIEQAHGGRLPLDQTVVIIDQICQALEHAHANGVIHRDLKPGNIFLSGSPSPQPSPARGEGVSLPPPAAGEAGRRPEGPRAGEGASLGAAMLGDFGLAMALDRSRLTQAGMMVGTVAYMAPEQALGSEVTTKSDLYSLGAMLYELVTGRPPFVGDESVAIITQHLNTPPVAPSWHNPEVGPGLEALILRLLEKDPAKRPASATEVREILASVPSPSPQPSPARGEGVLSAAHPATAGERVLSPPPTAGEGEGEGAPRGSGQNPIYRRVFVGRENELRQLEAAFDAALSGQGALMAVVGEPGIGKTAICEQLTTYVAVRGARTLVGHCYEEGSLSLPYLPFVEALRSYVAARSPEALKEELGTDAGEVAKIVSEVRDRLRIEPAGPAGDAEEERWRLLQAVTSFLRHAASVQPILLVLEDLHWSDRGTLDLLLHLARNLSNARLLVIATYRDVEVDRTHPLSGALAELRRISAFDRIPLRGLTPDEVHRLINNVGGHEVRWGFAEAIHRQTEGNPLFVQEVLRYLVEEGLLVYRDGGWVGRWHETGEPLPEMSIPEGLRDVIGKRLSRLSAECNRLLAIAAVIGREFDLATLRDVAGVEEESLIVGLEEAIRVGVMEEQARPGVVRYRFSHAFFRQTLYEEMIAPRRLRLHQEVARSLERQYAGRLADHAAELADHFAQSTDAADLAKAVEYGELAARRATAVHGYGEAARLLEGALGVQEVLDPQDRVRRCDLLLTLCEALGPAGEGQRVVEQVAEEAFALAEAVNDPRRAARAAWLAIFEGLRRFAGGTSPGSPLQQLWSDRLDRVAQPGTPERIDADFQKSMTLFAQQGRWREAWALNDRAREAARQLGDTGQLAISANLGWAAPKNLDAFMALIQEIAEFPPEARAMPSTWALAVFNSNYASTCLMLGDRAAAEQAQREEERLAERSQDPLLLLSPLMHEGERFMLDGDLESALAAGERLVARGDELGGPVLGRINASSFTFRPLIWLGRPMDALAAALSARQRGGWADRPNWFRVGERALCLAHAGQSDEARTQLAHDLAHTDISEDTPIRVLSSLLEAAILLEDREAAALLAPLLTEVTAFYYPTKSVALLVGRAAALLGDPVAARAHYERSLDWATKIRFRPEIAFTRLAMAELAVSDQPSATSGQESKLTGAKLKAETREHLDFAIKEFEAMKMQPALDHARQLEARLGA